MLRTICEVHLKDVVIPKDAFVIVLPRQSDELKKGKCRIMYDNAVFTINKETLTVMF